MSSGYVIPVAPSELAARFPAAHDPRFDREDELVELDEAENVSDEDVAGFFGGSDYESRIVPLLDLIPSKEADLIHLYFIQRKRQFDIAQIFGITQAAVSYRLERGIARLRFLLSIPQFTEEELRADLPTVFPSVTPCPKCKDKKAAPPTVDPQQLSEWEARKTAWEARNSPYRGQPFPEPPPKAICQVCQGRGSILIDVAILVGMWQSSCQSQVATSLGLTQGRVRHRFFKAVEVLAAAAKKNERFEPHHKLFVAISQNFNIQREVSLPQWANRGIDECG